MSTTEPPAIPGGADAAPGSDPEPTTVDDTGGAADEAGVAPNGPGGTQHEAGVGSDGPGGTPDDPTEEPIAALAAVTSGTSQLVGRFVYDVPSERWWWSESIYQMHGFAPGEVVPTTDLMLAHQHPDDRARGLEVLTAAISTGQPFSSRHRIIDTASRTRMIVTIGEGVGAPGSVRQVRGYFIDTTESLRRDLAQHSQDAVERSAETRAAIEQAKGALMVTYGIAGDEAFALLRWQSQQNNIKLRDLAAALTADLNAPELAPLTPAATIGEILARIAGDPESAVQTADQA